MCSKHHFDLTEIEILKIFLLFVCSDEFKGHSLLQAAREADMAKAKKTLALEIINFKHPHTHETALVRCTAQVSPPMSSVAQKLPLCLTLCALVVLALCSSVTSPQKETSRRAAVKERCQCQREE